MKVEIPVLAILENKRKPAVISRLIKNIAPGEIFLSQISNE
jgi:hypothetical protein